MMIEMITAGLNAVESVYGFALDYMLYIVASVAAVKILKSNANLKKESVAQAEENMEGAEAVW